MLHSRLCTLNCSALHWILTFLLNSALLVPIRFRLFRLWVSELHYHRRSVGQSVLVSSTQLGIKTRFLLLSDNCEFVDVYIRGTDHTQKTVYCKNRSVTQKLVKENPVPIVACADNIENTAQSSSIVVLPSNISNTSHYIRISVFNVILLPRK
jgi:hypothetical protein